MANYILTKIRVDEKELEEIFNEMDKAKEKLFDCYSRLDSLGVISFTRAEGEALVKDGSH